MCQTSSQCTGAGGTPVKGACPSTDGADIVCCTKGKCSSDSFSGVCRWESDCGGETATGLCPGGSQFKCCDCDNEFGGYEEPKAPVVGSCKQQSVDGAKKILAEFPGRIWDVGCYREGVCKDGSEHPCGRATDLMCSDKAGVSALRMRSWAGVGTHTQAGSVGCTDIAEWVMHNAEDLNVYYVIWGQRIWNTKIDQVADWKDWRAMENRNGITQNHW